MNKLPLWKLRAASWLPTLALAGLVSVLGYSGGHASEAQSPTIEAENDSIVDAFYLLKYDYEVLGARMASESKMDSLRIADIQAQLLDARKQRYRDLGVFGIAVAVAGLIFYLGGRAAQ